MKKIHVKAVLLFIFMVFLVSNYWTQKTLTQKLQLIHPLPISVRVRAVKNFCANSWTDCEAAVRYLVKKDRPRSWEPAIKNLRKKYSQDSVWGPILICARGQATYGINNIWNPGCRTFHDPRVREIEVEEMNRRPKTY